MAAPGFRRPRPTGRLELYAWFFMRISGLALVFLALGHLTVMHLVTGVGNIDFAFVARRFSTPFWRTYDLLMLTLALLHGSNGIKTLIDDYVHKRGRRIVCLVSLGAIAFVLLVLGSVVLLTFRG